MGYQPIARGGVEPVDPWPSPPPRKRRADYSGNYSGTGVRSCRRCGYEDRRPARFCAVCGLEARPAGYGQWYTLPAGVTCTQTREGSIVLATTDAESFRKRVEDRIGQRCKTHMLLELHNAGLISANDVRTLSGRPPIVDVGRGVIRDAAGSD